MRIDVHAHAWSNEYLELIAREGVDYMRPLAKYLVNLGGLTTPDDLASRFALMDEVGLDLQVLSPSGIAFYSQDKVQAVRNARYSNDFYAKLVQSHPDRFRAFAVLPLPHVEASLAELERALDELDMVGVTMNTSVFDRSPADPHFTPIWEALNDRSAVIFFHPAGVAAGSQHVIDSELTWNLGATFEDTLCAAQLIFSGIPTRYPNVKIIMAHLGGALPMQIARLDDRPDPTLVMPDTEELPSELAKRMSYDVLVFGHSPALRCAVDTFGAERLVLGTDFPFISGDGFKLGVNYVGDAGLPQVAVQQILDINAGKLLGI